MGHPIDPDDPVNGGVPTCLAYMPDALYAHVWRWCGPETYWGGIVNADPPGSGQYGGLLFGVEVPQFFHCNFGLFDPPTFWAFINILPFVPIAPHHCGVPLDFKSAVMGPSDFTGVIEEVG